MSQKIDVDCPECGANMIKSYAEEAKFRCKLIKWDKEGMKAICKSCDHEVPISVDVLKSVESTFVFEADKNLKK
jgi:DNA-directed RNA polymerase subunit M/transcription elongation factor TFIIS